LGGALTGVKAREAPLVIGVFLLVVLATEQDAATEAKERRADKSDELDKVEEEEPRVEQELRELGDEGNEGGLDGVEGVRERAGTCGGEELAEGRDELDPQTEEDQVAARAEGKLLTGGRANKRGVSKDLGGGLEGFTGCLHCKLTLVLQRIRPFLLPDGSMSGSVENIFAPVASS
jgi:hypothetical protein